MSNKPSQKTRRDNTGCPPPICSAVDAIRLQIARLDAHANPGNVAPSKRQCAIISRQLTKATEGIENHFGDTNKREEVPENENQN